MLAKTATIAVAQGRSWYAHPSASGAVGESGGDVEEAVAQRLGLTGRQHCGVADQGEEPGPGGQVGRDLGEHQPRLIDLELPGREPAQAGVFGVPDPVSTRACARWRASRKASCPTLVLVTKAW